MGSLWLTILLFVTVISMLGIGTFMRLIRPTQHTAQYAKKEHVVPNKLPSFLTKLGVVIPIVLFGILAIVLWKSPDLFRPLIDPFFQHQRANRFVVLVAPFDDGSNGETGKVVARELVQVLQQEGNGLYTVELLGKPPADEAAALALTRRSTADMLIWGTVQSGGMLDDKTLMPRITYAPNGAYAPYAWYGYAARLRLPHQYIVAREPINGKVVLPTMTSALAHYATGNSDTSYAQLTILQQEQPALDTPLVWFIRGNVQWARGLTTQAIELYQRNTALILLTNDEDRATLHANLAAMQLDSGNIAASQQELDAARQYLNNVYTAEMHTTQGLVRLHEGNTADALTHLVAANNTLAPDVPKAMVLLSLAQTYREMGKLTEAETMLATAEEQQPLDADMVPASFKPFITNLVFSVMQEQRGLLTLAQAVQARGHLTWELEITPILQNDAAHDAVAILRQSLDTTKQLIAAWQKIATSTDATQHFTVNALINDDTLLVATGQEHQIHTVLNRQYYHLAMALIEEGRSDINKTDSFFVSVNTMVFGESGLRAFTEAQTILTMLAEEQQQPQPRPMAATDTPLPLQVAEARLLRVRGSNDVAFARYDDITRMAPQQPEGYYGKGAIVLMHGERETARAFFGEALARNDAFFPARITLATMAQQEGNWNEAIAQLRVLAQQYPTAETNIHLASLLRQSGREQFAEAEQLLEPFVRENNVRALIERARIRRDLAMQTNDDAHMQTAIADLERALTLEETSAEAAFELGMIDTVQQRYPEARTKFQAAIRYDNHHALAYLALADLYLGPLNDGKAAADVYEDVLAVGIQDPEKLQHIGDTLMYHDKFAKAAEAYRQALAIQGNNPYITHQLAQAYLKLQNPSGAIQAEQRTIQRASATATDTQSLRANASVGLGEAYLQIGDVAQATNHFNNALMIQSAHSGAYIGLGKVAISRNNWQQARGYFEQAVAADSTNAQALFWYGEALLRQPALPQAIEQYEHALALQPDFPEALLGIAQARYAIDNQQVAYALEPIHTARTIRPRYAEAYLFECKVLHEHGAIPEAITACDNAISANDSIADAYFHRGTMHIQQMAYDAASSDLTTAAILQPTPETMYWLGRAKLSQGEPAQSVAALKQATTLQGGNYPDAQFYQALAEEALGQRTSAITLLESVAQNTGNNEWVQKAQSELGRLKEIPAPIQIRVIPVQQ